MYTCVVVTYSYLAILTYLKIVARSVSFRGVERRGQQLQYSVDTEPS